MTRATIILYARVLALAACAAWLTRYIIDHQQRHGHVVAGPATVWMEVPTP